MLLFYFDSNLEYWISGIDSRKLDDNDFPIFLKPKYGTSNKGIIKFKNLTEFKDFSLDKDKEKIVLQKSLQLDVESFEVTSSIVISRNGRIVSNPFHAKRVLNKGISWIIEKYNSKQLDKIVLAIANNMKGYIGSLNIQFMGSEERDFILLK